MQVPQIGKQHSSRLAAAGISTLQQLSGLDPRRLETIVQRSYPFGNQIRQEIQRLMVPEVKLQIRPLRESLQSPWRICGIKSELCNILAEILGHALMGML